MNQFTGPGRYLVLPLRRVTHPECEAINPGDKCLCVYPEVRVPFAGTYSDDKGHWCDVQLPTFEMYKLAIQSGSDEK